MRADSSLRVASPALPPAALAAVAAAVAALAIGVVAAYGRGLALAGVLLVVLAFAVGLRDWRWSLVGLILYVPLSGIPYVIAYPNTTGPVLAKDLLFVLPAYAGFAGTLVLRRQSLPRDRAMLTLFVLLALLVLLQILNPATPNLRVGAIGAKVWLLYLPMYFLGYAFVETRRDLGRLLAFLSLAAIVPSIVGITEALLIYSGHGTTVYGAYGAAADAVTQHFAAITYTTGRAIQRVPSTFSYVAQFYGFCAASLVAAFAWWRGFLVGTRWQRFGGALCLLIALAALLTGQLGAFIFIPVLVLTLMFLLSGRRDLLSPRYVLTGGIGAVVGSAVIGATFGIDLIREAITTGIWEFNLLFIQGLSQSFPRAVLGLGTGTDTTASRYAFTDQSAFSGAQEAWYVKALLELGVAGLVLVLLLLCTVLIRALKVHWSLPDAALRAASAAIIAFVIWNMIYNVKASLMDFDPINVYFWLFAGVLARIAVLGGRRAETGKTSTGPASRAIPSSRGSAP